MEIMKEDIIREIVLDEGVIAEFVDSIVNIKGPKGETERSFRHPKIRVSQDGNKVVLKAAKATKREKKAIRSFEAHLKNMVKGVQEPHIYKMKVCSGHFPMNVSVSGHEFVIKNFLGESVPRKVTLLPGSEVKVNGTEIIVSSPDKEVAGQNAAKIESLCRITKSDRRIFQDGVFITVKAGKKV